MPKVPAVQVEQISKVYNGKVEALRGVSLNINQGDFYGLLGLNGAGKSTLIHILTSLSMPTGGDATIMGHDLATKRALAKMQIGIVPQEINLNTFEKCINIVTQQGQYYGMTRSAAVQSAEALLKTLHLWDKRNQPTKALSGGMKRRLMIARALVHHPKILVLDEPTTGIDIELRQATWTFLKELNQKGTTILLTTHYLEEAETLCNRLGILHSGKLIKEGNTSELLSGLNCRHFVLTVDKAIKQVPKSDEFDMHLPTPTTLSVSFSAQHSLSELFTLLNKQKIKVLDISKPQNPLEQLFSELISSESVSEATP